MANRTRSISVFLTLLLLVAVCLPSQAATITGTGVDTAGATLASKRWVFSPMDTPFAQGINTALPVPSQQVTSDAAGAFTVTLLEGSYRVSVDGLAIGFIRVPSGTGVYNINEVWGCFVYLPNCLEFPAANSAGYLSNDGNGVTSWVDLGTTGLWHELGGYLTPTNSAAAVSIPTLVISGNALNIGASNPVGFVKNTNDTSLRIKIAGYETEKLYAASHYWLGGYRLGWLYSTIDSVVNLELTHEDYTTIGISGPGPAVLRLYGQTNALTGVWSRLQVTGATTNNNVVLDVQNSTGNAGGYTFKSNTSTLATLDSSNGFQVSSATTNLNTAATGWAMGAGIVTNLYTTSPNGTRWKINVGNDGSISATAE